MPRPIDADAIVNYHVTCTNGQEYVLLPVKTLAEYPTLDYEPVRHGAWVGLEFDGYADGCPVYDLWECSECKGEHKGEDDTLTDYCPNCGAKMDGGKQ